MELRIRQKKEEERKDELHHTLLTFWVRPDRSIANNRNSLLMRETIRQPRIMSN